MKMQPAHVVRHSFNELFTQIKESFRKNNGEITPDQLVHMYNIEGDDVERALLSIEAAQVTLFADEYDRKIFMVETNPGKCYFVYYSVDFCTCHSYKHRVLKMEPDSFLCKHIIIVKLADAMYKIIKKPIEQAKLSTILANPSEFNKEEDVIVMRVTNEQASS